MTSHDACTSGTTRVLTVASLQRLKMEALIPAPPTVKCDLWQSFWMHRAQRPSKFIVSCARSMGLTSRESRWCIVGADNLQQVDNTCMMRRTVGGHPSLRTTLWSLCGNLAPSDFHLFLHLKKFLSCQRQRFKEWRRGGDECHKEVSNPRQQTSTTDGYKSWSNSMTNVSIPQVNMLKNRSILAVSVPINRSIILGFLTVYL